MKFLKISSLIALIAFSDDVRIHAEVVTAPCISKFQDLPAKGVPLSPNASFKDLTQALGSRARDATSVSASSIRERAARVRQSIQRLVEPQFDSDAAPASVFYKFPVPPMTSKNSIDPVALMKSHQDWAGAVRYIEGDAEGRKISVDLLEDLHKLTCKNMFFYGFEGRRIAARYRNGEFDHAEFKRLLKQAYEKNESISGVDHQTLVGKFRSDVADQLSHHGSSLDGTGRRYFTVNEFQAFQKNEFMTLLPGSMKREADGKIRAEFRYVDVKKVREAAQSAIERANQTIDARSSTLDEKVRAIVRMQKDLVSIHPFLDGSGRTIKLLADLMYQRLGLPFPARPNERDLEMSIEEATEYVRQQMIQTLNQPKPGGV